MGREEVVPGEAKAAGMGGESGERSKDQPRSKVWWESRV